MESWEIQQGPTSNAKNSTEERKSSRGTQEVPKWFDWILLD